MNFDVSTKAKASRYSNLDGVIGLKECGGGIYGRSVMPTTVAIRRHSSEKREVFTVKQKIKLTEVARHGFLLLR